VGIKGTLQAAGELTLWRSLVIGSIVLLFSYVFGSAWYVSRMGDSQSVKTLVQISIPCIYLFVVDAVPNAGEAMASYKYTIFQDQCALQGLSIISSCSSILGMAVYGSMFVGVSVEIGVLATTILSAYAGALGYFKASNLPLPPFAVWASIDVVGSVFGAMFLLAKETVATHFSFCLQRRAEVSQAVAEPIQLSAPLGEVISEAGQSDASKQGHKPAFSPGILYSIYLTCFDIGGSAGGFLSAAIITSLGITQTDFSSLGVFVLLSTALFVATVALVPTIKHANKTMSYSTGRTQVRGST